MARLFDVACLQFIGGRQVIALQDIGPVQLRQQVDDFFLRGDIVTEAFGGDLPDFIERPLAVQ